MASAPRRTLHAFTFFIAAFLLQCAAVAAAPVEDLRIASDGLWRDTAQADVQQAGERDIVPQRFRLVTLDRAVFQDQFSRAPMESSPGSLAGGVVISLPMPDGDVGRFQIVETGVMAPELAAKFPEIKTWAGKGLDDPAATVFLDSTPQGFHAMVLSPRGRIFIDPYSRNDTANYISYYTRDHISPSRGKVFFQPPVDPGGLRAAEIQQLLAKSPQAMSGTQLRTYKLAIAATTEYTAFHGGTVPLGLAAITTAVNRVTGIYEMEVAVRLELVANNNLIVYAGSDPYTNNSPSQLLSQNQTNLDMVILPANYDIGHVFSTAGGGLAALGVVCASGSKARGETGTSSPINDAFYVDYVAHEMGHQFGGNHTFNSNTSNCGGGNRNQSTSYEPGSGSTIMAYAGICAADDLQPHSDPYFHTASFDEIVAYSTSVPIVPGTCGTSMTPTGNNVPVPSVPAGGFTIPANTPFALTGSATDADGDALTYNWEEYDLGVNPGNSLGDATKAPFFRSWNATTDPTRTFPRLSNLLANTLPKGEILPNVTRALNFRMTARDNRTGGGGVAYASLSFNVSTAAGPFQVTSPNSAVTWAPGAQTVTWNVANTTSPPVSCANVDILLSTDGGLTFPTVLLAATPNDGTQSVTIPNISTSSARIKVACSTNVFFDISNTSFTIGVVAGPTVATNAATAVASTGATLNGTVSSNGFATTVTFQYGPTTGYGTNVPAAQSPLAPGATNSPVSAAITGLTCGTLYHFRVVGSSSDGTNNGADMTFTTSACGGAPTTTTLASSNNPSTLGATVNFTASVTGVAPTGTVAFRDSGVVITGCSAVALSGAGNTRTAVCATSSLTAGTHPIIATYSGDVANGGSASSALMQQVTSALPGVATIVANPYGTVTVQGATLNGNVISNWSSNVVIEFGNFQGTPGSFAQVDFQALDLGAGNVLTIKSGASGQKIILKNGGTSASAIGGTIQAQGSGSPAPELVLHNFYGMTIAATGVVTGPLGLTLGTQGPTPTSGAGIVNQGVVDGGSQLSVFAASINGGGTFKGNTIVLGTYGNANNPVNGSFFLLNGLQLYPSTGNAVNLILNDYGATKQVLNIMINGDATVWMPSAWPVGVGLTPNNAPLAPGTVRPPGTPEPAYGGGSMIVQATGALSLMNGGTNDFAFPGAIVLKAGTSLNLNSVIVNQGWTVTGQQFQGIFLESPNIFSSAGNIQVYSNFPNWVNFSTLPNTPVRAFSLALQGDGSASFIVADTFIPHMNTYSVITNIAATGGCWQCAINTQVIDVYGP